MKTLINQYFNWLCGHSVELGQLNEHQIWHVDSCHICSCNWGLEIFELFPSANQEVTKSKMAPNVLFRLFLLSSATTKFSHHQHWRRSDTYHSYANELVKFCHDLYYRFQGLDGTKMTKISFRLHSLGCPGLVLCQIITVKSMDFWKREFLGRVVFNQKSSIR